MSIIKQVTLQKTVAHDFRYDPRICNYTAHVTTEPIRKLLVSFLRNTKRVTYLLTLLLTYSMEQNPS